MTNRVGLRTVEQFMADYAPVYQPIYPLLMNKSQSYSEEVGKIDFKRVDTVGDIRAKHITPKDTEIYQVAAKESSKTFKKYFLANQYVQSSLQDQKGIEDVNAQVLDEHQKQFDEIVLLGEGTSNSNMINNALYHSADPNYTLASSVEIDTDADSLLDMHAKVMASAAIADQLPGRKLIIFYGSEVLSRLSGIYAASSQPFRTTLQGALGSDYSIAKLPSAITPASSHGWIIVSLDHVKLHYTTLPQIKSAGVNEEKMYAWSNFLMGSAMLEVLASGGVIRQPVTIEA